MLIAPRQGSRWEFNIALAVASSRAFVSAVFMLLPRPDFQHDTSSIASAHAPGAADTATPSSYHPFFVGTMTASTTDFPTTQPFSGSESQRRLVCVHRSGYMQRLGWVHPSRTPSFRLPRSTLIVTRTFICGLFCTIEHDPKSMIMRALHH